MVNLWKINAVFIRNSNSVFQPFLCALDVSQECWIVSSSNAGKESEFCFCFFLWRQPLLFDLQKLPSVQTKVNNSKLAMIRFIALKLCSYLPLPGQAETQTYVFSRASYASCYIYSPLPSPPPF